MHFESFALDLVTTENAQKFVSLQQTFNWFFTKVVRALTLWIILKLSFLCLNVVHRICPKQITENTFKRNFVESVYLVDLFNFSKAR